MSSSAAVSEAQLAANRQNARNSTGPNTAAGKSRVRLNALNHGLTGDIILMPYEDAARYKSFIDGIIAALEPKGQTEESLARAIADGHWRLNRARSIEDNIFALGAVNNGAGMADPEVSALGQAQTYLDHARQFDLLTIYAGRIDRAIRRNAAELKELQAGRRAAEEKAIEEATILTQLAESKGQSFDPTANGFEFSEDFLPRRIDRQTRLAEARGQFPGHLKRAA